MASINSLMGSSSSSSIYGNSNVISGLASGMDTEAMIENAVSGIKTKIEDLNKDRTKLEWEQEAYQSIVDKLTAFSDKYTPKFTDSSTDLLSETFFQNATKVITSGANKDLISAVGESSSDIKITAVKLAEQAKLSGTVLTRKDNKDVTGDTKLSELNLTAAGSITINNKQITFSNDDTLTSIANKISKETGLEATFSETTGAFYLKSKETGDEQEITVKGSDAAALFGSGEVTAKGKDAEVSMIVNGQPIRAKKYDTNQITVDGMIISLKGEFGDLAAQPSASDAGVSFTTSVDTDKVVDVIKSMVEEFNTMANEIKDAYGTKPLTNSKGKRYEPLTEEEAKDMSETALEKYDKKAKTGLLFADSNLSALYNELRSAANALGYTDIGLSTEYDMSSGKTTLKLDEEKLRSTLEADPDKVKNAFLKGSEGTDDVSAMQKMQDTLQKYAKSVGEKGILIKLAGSTKIPASLNDNQYKSKLNDMDETIKRWQDKLSDRIDYYNKQFTRLEKMIADMNSQSSALMGFMGY